LTSITIKKVPGASYLVLKNDDAVGKIANTPSGWFCWSRTGDLLKIGPFATRDNALKGFVKWYEVEKPGMD
jgi:hypothetical protein